MLQFEIYDDENSARLSKDCLEDIAVIMERHGYTCCDHDEDTITFIAD